MGRIWSRSRLRCGVLLATFAASCFFTVAAPTVAAGAAPAATGVATSSPPAPGSADIIRFFRAVQLDDVRTVGKMVGSRVNPNQINPLGAEPGLVMALREDADRVFALLLAQPGIDLEATAVNGNTALMMAAFRHKAQAVDALLAHGAAVTQPGWTALHYAAAAGDDAIAQRLLAHHASVDAVSPQASGKFTPLMMAAREGHASMVGLLLKAGADASLRNGEGLSALQIAERADKPGIVAIIRAQVRAH